MKLLWQSMRGRLLILAVLVEIMMLTVLVNNSLRLLRMHMIKQAQVHANQIAPILNAALVAPLAQQDFATVQAVINESRVSQGIDYLVVLNTNGKIVATSGWPINKLLPVPDGNRLLSEEKLAPQLNLLIPIKLAGETLGELRIGLNLTPILLAHAELGTQGTAIALGEIVLSILLLTSLGYWLTRHLSVLTEAATAVAQGRYNLPPVPEGKDDIGQLGVAFNRMSLAIADRVAALMAADKAKAQLIARVEAEHAHLVALLSAIDVGILLIDQQQRIVYTNPALMKIWELPIDMDLRGSNIYALGKTVGFSLIPSAGEEMHVCHCEEVCEFKAHTGKIILQRQHPVLAENGELIGNLWIHEDITEKRLAEVQLLAAKEAAERGIRSQSAFLATMSHEVRTPLNGVLGLTELVLESDLDNEQREYLTLAHKSAQGLRDILNDILDFSKVDAGSMTLEQLPIALNELIEGAIGLFLGEATKKHLKLYADLPRELEQTIFLGDPIRLKQVLGNLLSNAVKFTEKGCVSLQVTKLESDILQFEVRDSGIGIPANQLEAIFTPFSQVDNSIARRFGGTGLGLAIVARLVTLMGGHLQVTSREGEGSCFTLILPVKFVTTTDLS